MAGTAGQWYALIGCYGRHRRPVARSNVLLWPTPQAEKEKREQKYVLRFLELLEDYYNRSDHIGITYVCRRTPASRLVVHVNQGLALTRVLRDKIKAWH